jgi:hypothetical protein
VITQLKRYEVQVLLKAGHTQPDVSWHAFGEYVRCLKERLSRG